MFDRVMLRVATAALWAAYAAVGLLLGALAGEGVCIIAQGRAGFGLLIVAGALLALYAIPRCVRRPRR